MRKNDNRISTMSGRYPGGVVEMSKRSVLKILCMFFGIIFTVAAYAETDMRCGTQEAHEAFILGEQKARPPDGPLYIYTPQFIVHYDTIGTHACTPAYAESVAVYAEYVRSIEVGGLGFAPPPPDYAGPDTRYDIYVRYLVGWYGVTYYGGSYPDPYPTGIATYIFVRNTMTWDQLRAVLAHEFNHACQHRYSIHYNWWNENVSCWMEEICYDHVNWYIISLNTSPNPLADPHLSIEENANEYEYAATTWAMFLQEYYGLSSLRLIWEEIGEAGDDDFLGAMDSVLHYYDSDLKMAVGNYAVWRYFTGARADTTCYFSESHLWPTSYVNPIHQHSGPGSGDQGTDYLDGPGGTSFIEFYTSPDYLLKTSLVGSQFGNWLGYSVGYSNVVGHRQYMMDSVDYWSIIPTMLHDTTVLIPTVTSLVQDCTFDYSGESISSAPVPPQDPDLEISSILSTTGTVTPYSIITPNAERRNNATSTTVDTTWASLYIGDWFSDSREIGLLNPGMTDTVSFNDWTALERNALDIRCVGGGEYDADIMNNYCDGSVLVILSDFEVLQILSPVSVAFTVENYSDIKSIYLEPESSAELFFDDWIPAELGSCSTSCSITTMDQRPFNNIIIGEVFVLDETGIEGESTLPAATLLHSPVPNPFASSTTVTFELAEPGNVRLNVFDLSGRLMETLVDGAMFTGVHSAVFDGTSMASGIYLIRLEDSYQTITTRVVLMR